MPPANGDKYVTYKDLNTFMWGALAGLLAMLGSVIGATWYLSAEINGLKLDIAILQTQLSNINVGALPEVQQTDIDAAGQVQYVVVVPSESVDIARAVEEARLRDIRIREHVALIQNRERGDAM